VRLTYGASKNSEVWPLVPLLKRHCCVIPWRRYALCTLLSACLISLYCICIAAARRRSYITLSCYNFTCLSDFRNYHCCVPSSPSGCFPAVINLLAADFCHRFTSRGARRGLPVLESSWGSNCAKVFPSPWLVSSSNLVARMSNDVAAQTSCVARISVRELGYNDSWPLTNG